MENTEEDTNLWSLLTCNTQEQYTVTNKNVNIIHLGFWEMHLPIFPPNLEVKAGEFFELRSLRPSWAI